jgi:hypothetical protein
MWLLDVNMPRNIVTVLAEFGISAQSAEMRGWSGLTNGMLVEVAGQAWLQLRTYSRPIVQ